MPRRVPSAPKHRAGDVAEAGVPDQRRRPGRARRPPGRRRGCARARGAAARPRAVGRPAGRVGERAYRLVGGRRGQPAVPEPVADQHLAPAVRARGPRRRRRRPARRSAAGSDPRPRPASGAAAGQTWATSTVPLPGTECRSDQTGLTDDRAQPDAEGARPSSGRRRSPARRRPCRGRSRSRRSRRRPDRPSAPGAPAECPGRRASPGCRPPRRPRSTGRRSGVPAWPARSARRSAGAADARRGAGFLHPEPDPVVEEPLG